ncbi:hypothetical protein KPH14_006695 [Odynerus spinipes]|uniref:Uncharacterized protein n=1 Tax=Odynerus spinipes TaxID=1348599 RepID=A0AAD9VRN4_9HYME|nr:hypothetical protein KPH14_006695 [Odynerus spinipes]
MTEENKTAKNFMQVSCNWTIDNNKHYVDAITTMPLSVVPERISLDDIISLDTCICLHSMEQEIEPCKLDIKTTNSQKISRIVILSEAYILEFFKQYGEYAGTVFAELVDKFDGNFVHLAEVTLDPPTTEASIKFTKTKNTQPILWIYGIKLILTEPVKENESEMLDYTVTNFLINLNGSTRKQANIAKKMLESFTSQGSNTTNDNDMSLKNLMTVFSNASEVRNNHKNIIEDIKKDDAICKEDCKDIEVTDIKAYINNKFHDMEERTMHRLDEIEQKMNRKLDAILEKLEVRLK